MAAPIWKIDNDGTVLTLTSSPYFLKEQQLPLPDVDPQYASSVTTEGDRLQSLRYRNRKITLSLRIVAASTAAAQTAVNDLQAKVGKINRDAVIGGTGYGGTLEFTTVNGTVVKFDVCSATMSTELGKSYVVRNGLDATVEFECAPFACGAEVDLGDNTGTAPMLVFTDTNVGGDVPGLGRLVVDNDSTADAASFVWGLRSYYYSSAATAALTWQAEALTPMNASAALAAQAGASGSGSNTITASKLTTIFQPVLKSTVGSTYWTHTGAYRVFTRVQGVGSGSISLRASWALADLVNYTTNPTKTLASNTVWSMMDLGIVRIPSGTTRWELRIEGKSSTNTSDDLYVDSILLMPVIEGYGTASITGAALTTLAANDTFDQSSGPNSQTLSPLGGTWGTAGGSSTDYSMDTTNKRVKRTTAAKDVSSPTVFNSIRDGRFLIETNANSPYTGQSARVRTYWDPNYVDLTWAGGVVLRYTDNSNFIAAVVSHSGGNLQMIVYMVVGGVGPTALGGTGLFQSTYYAPNSTVAVDAGAYANGYWWAVMSNPGTRLYQPLSGNSSVLATGGGLATGKYGIVDWTTSTSSYSRYYDDFIGYQTATDAAVFAASSGTPRPLTLDSKSVVRADSTNAVATRPALYSGDYLLIPPAGKESRTVQMAVRLGRGLIDNPGDDGTSDALSARLYVTPRYLQLPS